MIFLYIIIKNSMDTYNCNVEYRDYQNWSYQPNVSIDNPLNYKLFNGDTFYVDNDSVTLFDSPTRNCVNIPGILHWRIIEHMAGQKTKGNYFTSVAHMTEKYHTF